jgi:hypothetical protein
MSEEWESGHFVVVTPRLPHWIDIASSVPLNWADIAALATAYGTLKTYVNVQKTVGYAYRAFVDMHPDVLEKIGASSVENEVGSGNGDGEDARGDRVRASGAGSDPGEDAG